MTPTGSTSTEREAALAAYQILHTLPEQAYDDIALLAAELCATPMAAVSFMTSTEQWFKSQLGLTATSLPLDRTFCAHTLKQADAMLVIADAQAEAAFHDNPLVTGAPHIRFYAGATLCTPEHVPIGTICVADREPRELSAGQIAALRALARQIEAQLALRRTIAQLHAAERRFDAFMNNSPVIAFIKNAAGEMTYANQPYLHSFNLTAPEVLGKTDYELFPPAVAARFARQDQDALAGTETLRSEEALLTAAGDVRYWQSYKFPLEIEGERVLGGIALDITETKRYEQQVEAYQYELERTLLQVEAESITDGLTGIKNRRAFDAALGQEIERAALHGSPLALLLLDVDHFKQYNDAFGHPAGDEVLRMLGRVLSAGARASDTVARYGGEEFAVLLPHTALDGAQVVAERVRRAVELMTWPERSVTISVGVAALAGAELERAALIKLADAALYDAKRAGRNRTMAAAQAAPRVAARELVPAS